jgi:nucleoid-associated protein YgaU
MEALAVACKGAALAVAGSTWQHAAMRTQGWLVLAVMAAAAACGGGSAAPTNGDGALVLEVGGGQPSLRRALERAGLVVPPPIELSQAAAEPPPPPRSAKPDEPAAAPPAPPPGATPIPDAKPNALAEPAHTVVTLAEGQTLIHLARKHLGDGNRFREILALNGWTEAESRRLKAGTKVKVPKAGTARSGGR